jgi:hypothetical protein
VKAVSPHPTASPERTIDGSCDPNGQSLHAAAEGRRSLRLDEQMHVIHLDAELQNAEAVVGRHRECAADRAEQARSAKGPDARARAQRHVHRASCVVQRPPSMHDGSSAGRRLPTGPVATAAAGTNELELAHDLNRALLS